MKSKNKQLRPPPRKPWMLDNTSSSSLRNMEIGVPPGHKHPAPPPAVAAAYQTKPLPPLPLRRSGISRFSTEVRKALRTPVSVDYHFPEVQRDAREASIAVVLDTDSDSLDPPGKVSVDSGYTSFTKAPTPASHSLKSTSSVQKLPQVAAPAPSSLTLLNTNLPPSAAHKHTLMPSGSVQKLLQITGAGSASSLALTNTSQTPSGHNPAHKIKQVMGIEVPVHQARGSRSPAEEISPLTPESRSSSIYSQDRSNPASEVHHGHQPLLTPETSLTLSSHLEPTGAWRNSSVAPSAVPDSLRIVKANDRHNLSLDFTPVDQASSPTDNNYSHANGGFRQDLYHATVSELAQSNSASSVYSVTSGNSNLKGNGNFAYPRINIVPPPQRRASFSSHAYQSRTRFAPLLSKLDTLNAARHEAPVKTPYPLPMSRFEFDDDDETPTQRDYESDVSPRTTIRRPSFVNRIIRRASSPLSPTTHFAFPPEVPPKAPQRSHVSAMPSVQHLRPPPLLKHRKVKSQDAMRGPAQAVSNVSANVKRKSSRATSVIPPAPTSRAVSPAPHNYTNGTNRAASTLPQNNRPPTRNATPIPVSSHKTTTPLPRQPSHNTTKPTPNPFVPPLSHRRAVPPPVPPRGPSPPRYADPSSASSSTPSAVMSTLTAWAGRASERLVQARVAAGFGSRSERRRRNLKDNIKVLGPGRPLEGSTPVVVVRSAREAGKGSRRWSREAVKGGKNAKGGKAERQAKRGSKEGDAAGKAKRPVSGGRPPGVAGRKFEKYTPEKAAEKARKAAGGDGVKVWI